MRYRLGLLALQRPLTEEEWEEARKIWEEHRKRIEERGAPPGIEKKWEEARKIWEEAIERYEKWKKGIEERERRLREEGGESLRRDVAPPHPFALPNEVARQAWENIKAFAQANNYTLTPQDIAVHASLIGVSPQALLAALERTFGRSIKVVGGTIEHPMAVPVSERAASYVTAGLRVGGAPGRSTVARERRRERKKEEKFPTRYTAVKLDDKYRLDPGAEYDWVLECIEQDVPENALYVRKFLKCIRVSK